LAYYPDKFAFYDNRFWTTVMAETPSLDTPDRVGFLLVPQFPMYVFILAVEALRIANKRLGRRAFDWRVVSPDGAPVEASNGMQVTPDGPVSAELFFPTLLICAGYRPERYAERRLLNWLRRLDRHGAQLGGFDSGAVLLALAGLLDGYRVTVHWEGLASFQEAFPEIEVSDELFVIDRNRFSCAGGAVALDMMLNLIALRHGHALAREVAQDFVHGRIRSAGEDQRQALDHRWALDSPRLMAAIATMETNIDAPLTANELAAAVELSRRQLERLFQHHLGESPQRYYLKLRLGRARQLLLQSEMPVLEVALASGFSSLSCLSRAYRRHFGTTPRTDRKSFRAQALTPFLPELPMPLRLAWKAPPD
jgi:transcriptional regulator GlxA family with amidase domain